MERNLNSLTQAPSAKQLAGSAILECEQKLRALVPEGEHQKRALLKLMEAWFWARHQFEVCEAQEMQIQREASKIIK